jgi:hypothetical protein
MYLVLKTKRKKFSGLTSQLVLALAKHEEKGFNWLFVKTFLSLIPLVATEV